MIILGVILVFLSEIFFSVLSLIIISMSTTSMSTLSIITSLYWSQLLIILAGIVIFIVGLCKALNDNKKNNTEIQSKIYPISMNIATNIVLSIITFGIYSIYWEYILVKNIRALKNDDSSCTGEMLCLIFVPFYNLYWWYTRGQYVKDEFLKRGYSTSGSGIAYLVLGLFGLGIISAAIMQNDFNTLIQSNQQNNNNSTTNNNNMTSRKLCLLSLVFSALGLLFTIFDFSFGVLPVGFFIAAAIIGYNAKIKAFEDKQISVKLANQCFIAAIIGFTGILIILSLAAFIRVSNITSKLSSIY